MVDEDGVNQMFSIWIEDGKIIGDYVVTNDADGSHENIRTTWTSEKFESFMKKIAKYKVLCWKEAYLKGYEDEQLSSESWYFSVSFSDETWISSYGYSKKPRNFKKFYKMVTTYFVE